MPQLSLQSSARRPLVLAVGLTLLAAAAAGIVRGYQADRARSTWTLRSLGRAVLLEPDNAAGWHSLGRWEELSLAEGNLQRAREHYSRATQLNPHESQYWLDLANVLALTGAPQEAEAALAQALRVDPRTPATLWSVGNFWLRTAEPERGFPYLRAALEDDPAFALALLQTAHSAVRDPEVLLRELLPPRPRYLIAYLSLLVHEQDAAAAARVWRALVEPGGAFEAPQVLFYVNYLIASGDADSALKAWNDLKRLRRVPDAAGGGLLYNADLRREILNGGFDWRAANDPRVSIALGDGRPGASATAVVIRFPGEDNLHFQHFFQFVPVEPNTRYRFEAWASSENISTESGPRLEVYDPSAGTGAHSSALLGSNDWLPLAVEFATGPRSRLVRVGIVRLPSQRIENRIRGAVRVTEFSLRQVGR
ncbi:MAG: tetratricopeptide repeat protein [Acidobacteria bacterium]|nr:tetratricopeptide repeat protein [Acidobacteriota bacterium]